MNSVIAKLLEADPVRHMLSRFAAIRLLNSSIDVHEALRIADGLFLTGCAFRLPAHVLDNESEHLIRMLSSPGAIGEEGLDEIRFSCEDDRFWEVTTPTLDVWKEFEVDDHSAKAFLMGTVLEAGSQGENLLIDETLLARLASFSLLGHLMVNQGNVPCGDRSAVMKYFDLLPSFHCLLSSSIGRMTEAAFVIAAENACLDGWISYCLASLSCLFGKLPLFGWARSGSINENLLAPDVVSLATPRFLPDLFFVPSVRLGWSKPDSAVESATDAYHFIRRELESLARKQQPEQSGVEEICINYRTFWGRKLREMNEILAIAKPEVALA